MKRKVLLLITYDTYSATKQGIINVVSECSGAIEGVEEIKVGFGSREIGLVQFGKVSVVCKCGRVSPVALSRIHKVNCPGCGKPLTESARAAVVEKAKEPGK